MIALALFALAAPAADLDALLAEARAPLALTDDGWSGAGAALLEEAAAASAFFLVGEQHGNDETPRLTEVLIEKLRPLGYDTLAVEVGPITAERLSELAASDDVTAAFEELHTTYPFSVPFFWWRSEIELLATAAKNDVRLVGLDQEFVGSARMHLDRLRQLAKDEAALELVARWEERAWQAMEVFLAEGDTGAAALHRMSAADFDELDAAFASNPEARAILAEMRASAHVYQLYGSGKNYASNHARIRLMKRHLLQALEEGAPGGRTLLKFGNVHMGRGYSPLNQLDLGNQAAELGLAAGLDSFHLTVIGLAQEQADGSVSDYREQAPWLRSLEPPSDGWFVYDLRRLRPFFHDDRNRDAHPDLANAAFRFDAALVIPELTAAEYLVDFGR